jgi:hypothetical protein
MKPENIVTDCLSVSVSYLPNVLRMREKIVRPTGDPRRLATKARAVVDAHFAELLVDLCVDHLAKDDERKCQHVDVRRVRRQRIDGVWRGKDPRQRAQHGANARKRLDWIGAANQRLKLLRVVPHEKVE